MTPVTTTLQTTSVSPMRETRFIDRLSSPMSRLHVPDGGARYWIALSLASILGCNSGDLFASMFGFLSGLPILVIGFAAVLTAAGQSARRTTIYYWLAVILVRTAATNLADFAGHQFGLAATFGGLAVMLLASLWARRFQRGSDGQTIGDALPRVDALYWTTMLLAGTLGTAIGDASSFMSGLGLQGASAALSILVALLVASKLGFSIGSALFYWLVVVAIRAAGTSVGDLMAHDLGLWQSTAAFAILLAAFVTISGRWSRKSLAVR